MLSMHRSYSPGPVSFGHAKFEAQCATCHEPWHGASNAGCLDCHGDLGNNPHAGTKLADATSGVMPGVHMVGLKGELACLSCHTDHRGRMPNLMRTAGRTCVECHQHPSITDVSKHTKPVEMARGSKHFFKEAYSHKKHFDLLAKAMPTVKELPCKSCHEVQTPAEAGKHEEIVLKWSGCAGSTCHVNPQDSHLQMPASLGPSPVILASWSTLTTKHVNATFEHSPGHLQSECSFCHSDIQNSVKIGSSPDKHATKVLNCFECHAHQPEQKPVLQNASLLGAGVAFAQNNDGGMGGGSAGGAPEKKITACTGCHAFHVSGPVPTRDFTTPPAEVRPHMHQGLTLAMFAPGFDRREGKIQGVTVRPISVNPWWMGGLALVATGTLFGAWLRFLPRLTTAKRTVGKQGPQRMTEVPSFDDTYQSNVPRLYIVGELAGTASINLAMRSGRQAVEFISNLIKQSRTPTPPDVYDIAIIGCGPAGVSASATAINRGLKYVTLEKMTAISTIKSYPRHKFVQATAIDIAEYGSFLMEGDIVKEQLLGKWEEIIQKTGVKPNENEEVTSITREGDLFAIKTKPGNTYKARYVAMAIGVRGSPRHLGLAGETPERVKYDCVEPEMYQNKKVLVVGGGNAGTEVAQALAAPELHNQVSYSFRTATLIPPVSQENAEKISDMQKKGLMTVYPSSQMKEIKPGSVVLAPMASGGPDRQAGEGAVVLTQAAEVENDVIFAMLGAELPTGFMKSAGIKMIKKGH